MLKANGTRISMTEGDFGEKILLPITINGITINSDETIKFKIRIDRENEIIKNYSDIKNNTFSFYLTKAESESLKAGLYYYSIDWYKDENFLANIISGQTFLVGKKV